MKKALLFCLFLSGCAINPEPLPSGPPGTPIQLTPAQTQAVQTGVTQGFKDPTSAQFRNIRAVDKGQKIAVCGEVNGRNSFGGYVGFVPFEAFLGAAGNIAALGKIGRPGDMSSWDEVARECRAEGIL